MQESEAKAYFLRDLRKARAEVNAFYKLPHQFDSKKQVLTFLEQFRAAHEDVTLFEYKKPSRHPWHYCHTFFYLEPSAFEEEGVGKLMMVQKSTIDSKKLLKHDLEELLKIDLATDIMFHSHFFIRLIQRANLPGLKQALALVAHSVGVVLLYSKYEQAKLQTGQTVYVVFPDKVFVITPETEQKVMVFKTVLLAEFMTDKQKSLYAPAIQEAMKNKYGFATYVEDGDTLVKI
ncbi:hypothetical protein KIH87_14890 [Paraneptunicella aestuarii]|uniref:hypothetical protein n=1 Tax=Paraneptunicella aestuarii TaxID=2831148 RepID=UPI001E313489|nr:hypothetical protein [Paraneptunicella aestuarii]UAA37966.1 hypothetical protein KIH87_14890 [Paraneptunicella aestuarii]